MPEIDIAPGEYENLGASLSLPRVRASNVFELFDRASWNRGAHQWKFGASATFLQENAFTDTGMRGVKSPEKPLRREQLSSTIPTLSYARRAGFFGPEARSSSCSTSTARPPLASPTS